MIVKNSLMLSLIIFGGNFIANAIGSEVYCSEPLHTAPLAKTVGWREGPDNKVTLLGLGNPRNSPTKAWFEYGENESMTSGTGFVYVGDKENDVMINISTKPLKPNTTYYYKLVSQNEIGTTSGEIKTFTTGGK